MRVKRTLDYEFVHRLAVLSVVTLVLVALAVARVAA